MTEWSQKMAEKLKHRSEKRAIRDVKAQEKQRRIQHDGPSIWQALKSDVLMQAQALNTDMGRTVIVQRTTLSDELNLEADLVEGPRSVNVRFESHDGHLTWITTKGRTEKFALAIGDDGKLSFYSGIISYGTGSIARQILETLLD